MNEFIVILIATFALFVLYFVGMGIRIILTGDAFRGGGCGRGLIKHEKVLDCGVCPKKEIDLCKSSDTTGLADISELGTLGRFDEE